MRRRILIYTKIKNVDYLSMFLDVADSVEFLCGWCRYALFSLALISQIDNKQTIRKYMKDLPLKKYILHRSISKWIELHVWLRFSL